MNRLRILIILISLMISPALYANGELNVSGIWGTKYGEMLLLQKGSEVSGVLIKTTKYCPFKNGEKIFSATLLEDSLAGKFKMCQADDDCGEPVWAHAVFLVTESGKIITGSAYSKEAVCPLVGFSKSDSGDRGLYFKLLSKNTGQEKARKKKKKRRKEKDKNKKKDDKTFVDAPILPGPPAEPGTYDPRAKLKIRKPQQNKLLEGKQLLNTGQFEAARKKFREVLKKDKGNPVALVGIGVTYYGRNDYEKALRYYKKALASDPNFGMAYYNMASIYALQGKKAMAIRYLKIAFLNGFVPLEQMKEDPDLETLRKTPEYKKLVSGEF